MVTKMIKANFNKKKFVIIISIDKFKELWDDSYAICGEYKIEDNNEKIGIGNRCIDLDSFVAEQILTVLNKNGEEDEGANNEFFEDYDAQKCQIKEIVDDNVIITGTLVEF